MPVPICSGRVLKRSINATILNKNSQLTKLFQNRRGKKTNKTVKRKAKYIT